MNIDFQGILWNLKIISISLSVLFGLTFAYFFTKFQKLVQMKGLRARSFYSNVEPAAGGAVQSRWEEILDHSRSNREAEWKLAVIEADKLVDDLLKSAGYKGETMGERLMSIEPGQLESLNGLWEAHKIRNKLVHDTKYFLQHSEAQRAIVLFENALKELGVGV